MTATIAKMRVRRWGDMASILCADSQLRLDEPFPVPFSHPCARRNGMKSTVSFALVTCLVSSTFAAAQEHREPVGPIHRAIAQEAARRASVAQKQATDPGWWRVMAIAPRTQLALTPRGEAARIGLFATADESSMTHVYLSCATSPFSTNQPLQTLITS